MKNITKKLALITTGLVVGVVVGRVRKNSSNCIRITNSSLDNLFEELKAISVTV